jgi:hypothetical protein
MSRLDVDYMQAEIDALKEHNDELREQLGEWRECAEKLAPFVVPVPADMADHGACAAALAEFERLKEGGK